MKIKTAAFIFLGFLMPFALGAIFWAWASNSREEIEYWKGQLRMAGNTLCDHKKEKVPQVFKDPHCGCGAWSWHGDRLDVGVTCEYSNSAFAQDERGE